MIKEILAIVDTNLPPRLTDKSRKRTNCCLLLLWFHNEEETLKVDYAVCIVSNQNFNGNKTKRTTTLLKFP